MRPFSLTAYLRGLTTPRLVLWCYFIWYAFVVVRYFDGSPGLWFNSLGLSGIIGTALYLSTAHGGPTQTRLDGWQVFRLYLMPFCVSSFAALIKDRGFFMIFHPIPADNAVALGLLVFFCAAVASVKQRRRSHRADVALR